MVELVLLMRSIPELLAGLTGLLSSADVGVPANVVFGKMPFIEIANWYNSRRMLQFVGEDADKGNKFFVL